MYSEEFYRSGRVEEYPKPELQRVSLEEVVLQVGYTCGTHVDSMPYRSGAVSEHCGVIY
jgi:HrpA-like RNA helicase